MQFKQGASVYTSDGKDIGHIDRVVLNPRTKEVTHLVIRKGFLFSEDKLVPISLVAMGTGEGLTLRPDAGDLERRDGRGVTGYGPVLRCGRGRTPGPRRSTGR